MFTSNFIKEKYFKLIFIRISEFSAIAVFSRLFPVCGPFIFAFVGPSWLLFLLAAVMDLFDFGLAHCFVSVYVLARFSYDGSCFKKP